MNTIDHTKRRVAVLLGSLFAINILIWLVTWGASHTYPVLLATGWLAYAFGLRHAVDADHISAIDNTTRKLMQEGKQPIGVGFFFSLGHSTIVVLLCAALAVAASYVQQHLHGWQALGGQVGALVSSSFLYIIGFVNLIVFIDLVGRMRALSRGRDLDEEALHNAMEQRGFLARIFRPILRMVTSSRQMYLVGFLFGLGFDTATEVGLLGMSAHSGQTGTPIWVIMLLPALFTAGMCLIDTLNSVLMLGAYGWAFIKPVRKLYYNLSITLISVVVAFVIATQEMLGLAHIDLSPKGPFWQSLDDRLGFVIIAVFLAGWAISALLHKIRTYEPEQS
ncbi:nickel/cobalt efflux system [Capsulimonas corticalis]|uniref:Nickel/cobalt efflux system n=1 Tax=Capsulimonas corticalis TaxID=2219043 RepID=A0A402CRJ8_9BACT|nr:HoxN/HupN/NixA family nickel/cobalt transporter [Capsulimonas corticalis]BDI28067.1 nickel/cobalt efflux system [Capsulimonas corticalis]